MTLDDPDPRVQEWKIVALTEQAIANFGARQRAIQTAFLDTRCWRGDGFVLCGRNRGSGKLQKVAFGWRLDRLDHQALPVRRSRL